MKWYGSVNNRLEENKQFVKEIKVGDGVTEYSWSDRHPYEVTEVRDQKHITIRAMSHKHIGDGEMDNKWELISDPAQPSFDIVKKGQYWYHPVTATKQMVDSEDVETRFWIVVNGFDREKINKNGKQTKYNKMNISIGKAEFYYDYEF